MSSALHLALRGLFSLNAITLAVQGLIEDTAVQPEVREFRAAWGAGKGGGPDAELSLSDYLRRFGRVDALPGAAAQAAVDAAQARKMAERARQRRRRNVALLEICAVD